MIAHVIDPSGNLGEIRARLSTLLVISLLSIFVTVPLGFRLGVRLFGGFLIVLLLPAFLCFAQGIKALNSMSGDRSESYIRFFKGHFIFMAITLAAAIVDYKVSPTPQAFSYTFPKLATTVVYRDLFAGVIALQLFATVSLITAAREASQSKAGFETA